MATARKATTPVKTKNKAIYRAPMTVPTEQAGEIKNTIRDYGGQIIGESPAAEVTFEVVIEAIDIFELVRTLNEIKDEAYYSDFKWDASAIKTEA